MLSCSFFKKVADQESSDNWLIDCLPDSDVKNVTRELDFVGDKVFIFCPSLTLSTVILEVLRAWTTHYKIKISLCDLSQTLDAISSVHSAQSIETQSDFWLICTFSFQIYEFKFIFLGLRNSQDLVSSLAFWIRIMMQNFNDRKNAMNFSL